MVTHQREEGFPMRAIYKRELEIYFCSMTGYVFIAFHDHVHGHLFHGLQYDD